MTDHLTEAKRRATRAEGHMGSYIAAATPEGSEFHRTLAIIESNLAAAHAILAAAEAPQQSAGACPSTIRTGMFTSDGPEVFYCRHPDRHTGLHSNDPSMTEDNTEARWTDHSEGVTRVNQEKP